MRLLRHTPWWLVVLTLACAILLTVGFCFARLGDEKRWPTSLVVLLPQWSWLVPPGLLAVAAGLARCRAVLGIAVLLVGLSAVLLGGFEMATGSPEPATPRPAAAVRVVTWNLHNEHRRMAELGRRLMSLRPDIVCLQEAFDPHFATPLLPGWQVASAYGVRVQSRWPIAKSGEFGPEGGGFRDWMATRIATPGGDLAVLNVHFVQNLGGDSLERHYGTLAERLARYAGRSASQVQAVLEALPEGLPVVVAGDFNTPPDTAQHRALATRLTDAFAASAFGFGYTYVIGRRLPSWRIDYIWCGNGVRPVACRTAPAGPSDHRAVIADIVMPRACASTSP